MRRHPLRLVALFAALMVVCSSCYLAEVNELVANGATEKPWYCDPIAPNSVTGPGMGTTNFYAGQTRSELTWEECRYFAAQMDVAKDYAEQYPTAGDAFAAGFRTTFSFLTGMGTHTGAGAMTPELLADPSFNRLDPVFPGITDDVFKAGEPEFLQFNGNGPDARLIGMSWYVRTTTGQPPEGFTGGNDWWHNHPWLCFRSTDAIIIGVNQSDGTCTTNGGVNVDTHNYYMVHLWVVDGLNYEADVFAPTHPCIKSTGAIFDYGDPCHTSALDAPLASADPESTPTGAVDGAAAIFCPIGSVRLDESSGSPSTS